jgi:pimeloyl-ACP methyl ester carboxylesterase
LPLLPRSCFPRVVSTTLALSLTMVMIGPLPVQAREKLFVVNGPVNTAMAHPTGLKPLSKTIMTPPISLSSASTTLKPEATDALPHKNEPSEKLGLDNLPKVTATTQLQLLLPRQHSRYSLNQIYEFDHSPIGKRIPVILLPGRAEEYQQNSWWRSVHHRTRQNADYQKTFKTYLFLYDSKEELAVQAQGLATELRKNFAQLPKSQPLMLVSYSLGGVIAREVLADADILERVDTLIAIGVPFHGSPMFDSKWFTEYLNPPNRFAIRRFWDRANYHVYMLGKTNLQHGLKWDNFDSSKPVFKESKDGSVRVVETPETYVSYPNEDAIRKRMIVYGSFLENGYTNTAQPANPRRLPRYALKDGKGKSRQEKRESWLKIPGKILVSILPVYGLTVHSVFTYMNYQLANLPSHTQELPEGKNTHLYRYNDGAIPLTSDLFLSSREKPYGESLDTLVKETHARKVRIFANLDHVDLGEYNLLKSKLRRSDVIHPEEGAFLPNQWILLDLCQRAQDLKLPAATAINP